MKKVLILAMFTLGVELSNVVQAQSFYGYQTIGQKTVFFSISYNGKVNLGVGYNHRDFGKSFTDLQAELRFPLDDMYSFQNYTVIAGMYRPNKIAKRFTGVGMHVRLNTQTMTDKKNTSVKFALTAMPSYVYARSLTDGSYGTMGLRLTYVPTIINYSTIKGKQTVIKFPSHDAELGGHLDWHYERTFGLAVNAFHTKTLSSWIPEGSEKAPKIQSNFYMGSTYRIR